MKKGQNWFNIKTAPIYFAIPILLYFAYSFNFLTLLQMASQKSLSFVLIPTWGATVLLMFKSSIGGHRMTRSSKEKVIYYSLFISFILVYFSVFSLKVPIISADTNTVCTPSCSGKLCGSYDGCSTSCTYGSGCLIGSGMSCTSSAQCTTGYCDPSTGLCGSCSTQTCSSLGKECGSGWSDGCGGTLNCGTCPASKQSGDTCLLSPTCSSGTCTYATTVYSKPDSYYTSGGTCYYNCPVSCTSNGWSRGTCSSSATINDNNACTTDACTSSGVTHTNVADGTSCGTNLACSSGKCVAQCSTSDSDGTGFAETCKDSSGTYTAFCSSQNNGYYYTCSNNACASTNYATCTSDQTCTIKSTGEPYCKPKDSTSPTTSITCNSGTCSTGLYKSGVSISLSCADNTGGSGCAKTEYCVDNMNTCTPATSYLTSFSVSGTMYVRYRSTDNAVNIEATKSTAVNIDSASPTVGTIYPSSAIADTAQTFSVSVSDDNGISSCNFYVDGTDKGAMTLTSPCKTCTASKSYTFTTTKSSYQVHATCSDSAGNKASGSDITISNFQTSPVCQWGAISGAAVQNCYYIPTTECYDANCKVSVTGCDVVKGSNACEVEWDGNIEPSVLDNSCKGTDNVDHDYAAVNKCPNAPLQDGASTSSLNGRSCMTYEWTGNWWSSVSARSGTWDASGRKCMVCDGKVEKTILGDTSQLYGAGITIGSGSCESACGSIVDDTTSPVVQSISVDNKVCAGEMPVKKGTSFTLGYTVVGGPNSNDKEVVSVNSCQGTSCSSVSGDRIDCNNNVDASVCSSKSSSSSLVAPSTYGKYTYSVAVGSQNCNNSPTDTKSCTIIAAECLTNADCTKLVDGKTTTCDTREGSPTQWSCIAAAKCTLSSGCGTGFCCDAEIGKEGNCLSIKNVANPYVCK